jgi:nucleotide-binding universal stress UspA family protein
VGRRKLLFLIGAPGKIMRILLAIDGARTAQTATQAVIDQFRCEGTQVHVLHAIVWSRVFPEHFSFGRGPEFAAEFKEFLQHEREWARQMTGESAAALRNAGFQTSCGVVEGDPKQAILDYAASWRPDLIILLSHDRTGLDRIVYGSVSASVARHAPCSVQIMRKAA